MSNLKCPPSNEYIRRDPSTIVIEYLHPDERKITKYRENLSYQLKGACPRIYDMNQSLHEIIFRLNLYYKAWC